MTMIDKVDIFPIGIGGWGLGGFATKDDGVDFAKQTEAVAYSFSRGQNFAEINQWYAEGMSAKIIRDGLFMSKVNRKDVILCQSLYVKDKRFESSSEELDKTLDMFETKFVDILQFTQGVFLQFGYESCKDFLQYALKSGKTKYIGVTNEDLNLLQKLFLDFGKRLISHEVCFNFEVRENEKLGIIPFANKNNIRTVVYQPLRRNKTFSRNWPLLKTLSQKYLVSENQLIISWLLKKGFILLTKSTNIEHIKENLDAKKLNLTEEDFLKIDQFLPKGYTSPKIDWSGTGDGVRIDQLSNVIDGYLENIS